MDIKIIFGENVKKYRKQKGITQTQLAEILEVEQKHISFIENGNSFPSSNLIGKIAEALNIAPMKLFSFEDEPTPEEMKNRILALVNNATAKEIEKIYIYTTHICHNFSVD